MVAVQVSFGAWDPELAALTEPWEAIYETKLECAPSYQSQPVCKVLAESVDFASVVMTGRGVFILMSKRGQDWPFYGFRVGAHNGGATFKGTTSDLRLRVEISLDRDSVTGALSGWVRDPRIPGDVKVSATPIPVNVKRPLHRLYQRKLLGEPLQVGEVAGNYNGKVYGEDARLVVKDSALTPEPTLSQASFLRVKENTVEIFEEVSLDSTRGLVFLVQYDGGLPNRKWVLAFRREDIDLYPSLLGTGINLRKPVVYDVDFDKTDLLRR